MQKRARKSIATSSPPSPKRQRQIAQPTIGYTAVKYDGVDVYKFLLYCENPITTKENLTAYHFLRTVMNGVLIFEDMVTSAPAPSDELYTVKELVGDLARRIEETTDREIDKNLYTKLVKSEALDEETMDEMAENLKSCFFVYTFNSEFDLISQYTDRNITNEMKNWYKKTQDDHPTLIAFIIRNTFKFVLWRVEYDAKTKIVDFYEFVQDEEEEESDTLFQKVWKKIVRSDDPTVGYTFETDDYDSVKYYMYNMKPM